MMPDGSYRMSQTQADETIGKPQRNAGRFLTSKAFKALCGELYTDHTFKKIAVETAGEYRGETRINAVPLDKAMLRDGIRLPTLLAKTKVLSMFYSPMSSIISLNATKIERQRV
jgi:hypothetical protein